MTKVGESNAHPPLSLAQESVSIKKSLEVRVLVSAAGVRGGGLLIVVLRGALVISSLCIYVNMCPYICANSILNLNLNRPGRHKSEERPGDGLLLPALLAFVAPDGDYRYPELDNFALLWARNRHVLDFGE